MAIGARGRDTYGIQAGEAYVLEEPMGGWAASPTVTVAANLHSSQTTAGDSFGSGIDVDVNRVLVGAEADDPGSVVDAGRVFVFELQGTHWVEIHWLGDPNPGAMENLGVGVALDGTTALVGNHRDNNASGTNAGAVHVFELVPCIELYCFCDAHPCTNVDRTAGCANVTGAGAFLSAAGTTSVTNDDLVLHASNLTVNPQAAPVEYAIFYMGNASTAPTPWGNGLRCIGGSTYRFVLQTTSGDDSIELGPGIVGESHARFEPNGHIQAGSTWHFQTWYRDSNGACGANFNTSNAIEVSFQP